MSSVSHQMLSLDQWSQEYLPWNDISSYAVRYISREMQMTDKTHDSNISVLKPSIYHDMHVTENNLNTENPGYEPNILDLPNNFWTEIGFDSTNPIINDNFDSSIYYQSDSPGGSRWGGQPPSAQDEYPFPTTNHHAPYSYSQLRGIMKLNLELISDMELLDAASNLLSSLLVLGQNRRHGASKIHLPIFRILNHSSQFLNILQQGDIFPLIQVQNTSPITPPENDTNPRENLCSVSKEIINSCLGDMPDFMTSHESGYTEINPVLSNFFGGKISLGHRTSESLTILSSYCQLTHVYHALFAQIYQTLVMTRPDDAAEVFALPTLHFGEFHMEGHFKAKLQVLIELSFSILRTIDHLLGIPETVPGEFSAEGSPSPYIPYHGPLESLRDHIVAGEYMEAGMPLRKLMHCLQAVFDTTADITV